jgi:hypothetical protein
MQCQIKPVTSRALPSVLFVLFLSACGGGGGSSSGDGSSSSGVSNGSFTLKWTAPVARTDGTPLSLSDISGFFVYYGKSSGNYTSFVDVPDGTATSVTVTDVPVGTWYVVMTTYDDSGRESAYSAEITKTSR